MDETTRTLGDRYEVGDVLGRGGMAEVHLGRDSRLGRTVAIKVLRADMARDPVFHARFRREAQSAAGMNHPSIVAVYDTGEDVRVESGGTSVKLPYIVMEHVAGRTVRDVLVAAGGPGVGTERAVAITAGVLTALDYSHRHGIVHRDIKPANVMVTPTGDVKVMDFGIARAVADSSITMTQTSAVIGTAQYLSPEQARGQVVDARTDLYSAGCLLYELLTGRPPFVGDSAVSVAYQHVREIPLPPSEFNPAVAEAMDRVVLKALAKDREDRYAGAEEFREDLLAAGAGHPVMAPAVAVAAATQVVPTTTEATRALASAGFSVGAAPTVARGWADEDTGLHAGPGGLDHRDGTRDEDGFDDVFSPTTSGRQGAVGTSWEAERSGATRAGGAGGRDGPDGRSGPAQHRRRRWGVIVPLVVLLLLAAGAGTWGVLAVVGRVVVPDVTDRTVAQATTTLKAVDLGVTQHTEADAAAAGTVIAQDPKGSTRAAKGDVVALTVSSGPSSVSVPDLTNKTEAQAAAALARVGLTEGEAKTQDDPGTPAGRVVSSDPTSGTAVEPGRAVDLVLSSGKVTVPDLTGKTSAEAQQALTDLQLKPFLTQTVRSDKPAGTVVAQSPASGLVDPGDSVTLIIAVAPAATATPTSTPTTPATPTPTPTATPSPTAQPSPSATDDDPSESPAPSSTAAGTRATPSTDAAGEVAAPAADLRAAD